MLGPQTQKSPRGAGLSQEATMVVVIEALAVGLGATAVYVGVLMVCNYFLGG